MKRQPLKSPVLLMYSANIDADGLVMNNSGVPQSTSYAIIS